MSDVKYAMAVWSANMFRSLPGGQGEVKSNQPIISPIFSARVFGAHRPRQRIRGVLAGRE